MNPPSFLQILAKHLYKGTCSYYFLPPVIHFTSKRIQNERKEDLNLWKITDITFFCHHQSSCTNRHSPPCRVLQSLPNAKKNSGHSATSFNIWNKVILLKEYPSCNCWAYSQYNTCQWIMSEDPNNNNSNKKYSKRANFCQGSSVFTFKGIVFGIF